MSGVSKKSGNPWMSQEYVIEVPGQYPKRCVFRIFGEDRIKQFGIRQNETVTVSFDIDAHEYNGRWFNEVAAYNVVRPNAAPQPAPQPAPQQYAPPPQQQAPFPPPQQQAGESTGADDLPF